MPNRLVTLGPEKLRRRLRGGLRRKNHSETIYYGFSRIGRIIPSVGGRTGEILRRNKTGLSIGICQIRY